MGLHSPCSHRAWNQILHYGIREHQHFSKGCTLLNTFKTLSTDSTDSTDCNIEVQTKGPEQDDWETSWVVTSVAVSANLSCDFMWFLHFWNEKPVVFHTFFISKTTRWPSQIQQLDEMSKRTRWAWRRAREPRPDQIRTRWNEWNRQFRSDAQRCSACHWVLPCLAASFPLSGCQAASPRASVDSVPRRFTRCVRTVRAKNSARAEGAQPDSQAENEPDSSRNSLRAIRLIPWYWYFTFTRVLCSPPTMWLRVITVLLKPIMIPMIPIRTYRNVKCVCVCGCVYVMFVGSVVTLQTTVHH